MVRRYLAALGSSLALHALAVACVVWMPSAAGGGTSSTANEIAVFIVPPAEEARFPGLNPLNASPRAWTVPQGDDSSLRIGDLRIEVGKIGSRAQVLFPFLTPGLSLESFLDGPRRHPQPRTELRNPLLSPRERVEQNAGGPLILSDAALQSLVDTSWARRDRWAAFEPLSRLADTHDPDTGALPALLQRYVDQNSLQPYADQTSRDPRLWAQLALAADHVDFIRFIRRYAAAHPSTRATTELLFLLDRIAEASRDALAVLLGSDPAEQLRWTHDTHPPAYRLLSEIRRYYEDELARLDLRTNEAVTVHYERLRLAILEGIVRTTPNHYRANDARFLIGAIYWRQGRAPEALRCWSDLTEAPGGSHAIVSTDLVRALGRHPVGRRSASGPSVDAALRREIDQILKNQHGRWVMFSYDRLRQFGYRFDKF